jgi:hypothetical protein
MKIKGGNVNQRPFLGPKKYKHFPIFYANYPLGINGGSYCFPHFINEELSVEALIF